MRSIFCGATFLMVIAAAATGCAVEQADTYDSEVSEDAEIVGSSAAAIESEVGSSRVGIDLVAGPGQSYVPQIGQLAPKKEIFVSKHGLPTKLVPTVTQYPGTTQYPGIWQYPTNPPIYPQL
ncbi:hypothetical protein [Sorangium sp. So ce385]|uniref:hypothetical protein n=1 Tax=Sorangium sp. So ce385 TaxID=3133308 RepID=UPI003F5C6B7E